MFILLPKNMAKHVVNCTTLQSLVKTSPPLNCMDLCICDNRNGRIISVDFCQLFDYLISHPRNGENN